MKEWHITYKYQGLLIISNHYPEFEYEQDLDNLINAGEELMIPYSVVQDIGGETWRAYHNRYWPTLYLIDKEGNLHYIHIGEGRYRETSAAIQTLLGESYL